jgi:MFS family permease
LRGKKDMAQAVEHRYSSDSLILKATLLITSTFTVMASATIAPSLPAMQAHFSDTADSAFWVRLVLTLPALFIVIGAPIAGYLIDKLGRKPLLFIAAMLYGLAGTSGFFADNLPLILVGRAFLGFAVAGIMTCVSTLISDYYYGKTRAQFLGFQSAFSGLGGTVFLTVGGVLADASWRGPFLIYFVAFMVLPLILMVLYEPQDGDISDKIMTQEMLITKTPIGLMIFVYVCLFLMQVIFYIVPTQLPFHLKILVEAPSSQSGLAIAWMTLFFALASSLSGWFAMRYNHLTLVIVAFLMTGIGYGLVGIAQDWVFVIIGLPISGFGIGLIVPNLNIWLAEMTPLAIRGRVFGGFATSVFLGQFISPFLSQPLINATTITTGFLVGAGLLLAVGIIILFNRKALVQFTQWVK